jgi:hypothetical protein
MASRSASCINRAKQNEKSLTSWEFVVNRLSTTRRNGLYQHCRRLSGITSDVQEKIHPDLLVKFIFTAIGVVGGDRTTIPLLPRGDKDATDTNQDTAADDELVDVLTAISVVSIGWQGN